MSSLAGHVFAGAVCYIAGRGARPVSSVWLLILIVCAVLPDLDYLVYWATGWVPQPRITHSVVFCLSVGLLSSRLHWIFPKLEQGKPDGWVILTAALAHIALDAMVAVHPNPYFWPLSAHGYRLPFGILPSAGRLQFDNIYLWRNLLIEFGVLVPISMLLRHRMGGKRKCVKSAWLWFAVLAVFVVCSIALSRATGPGPVTAGSGQCFPAPANSWLSL